MSHMRFLHVHVLHAFKLWVTCTVASQNFAASLHTYIATYFMNNLLCFIKANCIICKCKFVNPFLHFSLHASTNAHNQLVSLTVPELRLQNNYNLEKVIL